MSAENPTPTTPADKLATERKGFADLMRQLAADIEAGKVSLCGIAAARLCGECTERHIKTFTYIETETMIEATTMVGLAHALVEGATIVRNGIAMRNTFARAVALHEAEGATKQ